MTIHRKSAVALLLLSLVICASGRKRDPLTEAEADKLREVAMEPGKRLHLYIQFAEARLLAVDQLRTDPKLTEGRGQKVHDLLEDFTALIDEINDNLDQYSARQLNHDERGGFIKGLKELIQAEDRFNLKLRTLQAAAGSDPKMAKDAQFFRFVLQDAMEAVKSSSDVAREYVADEQVKDKEADKKNSKD